MSWPKISWIARIAGGIMLGLGLASLPFLQYRVGHHHPHAHHTHHP